MPYYIFRIFKDRPDIQVCYVFNTYQEAEEMERGMRRATYPEDNYFIEMIYAEDEMQGREKANALRKRYKG